MRVLAIDPGSDKCGVAVVDGLSGVVARGVVPTGTVVSVARQWVADHRPARLVVGSGTGLRALRAALAELGLPLEVQVETNTTLRARQRYFQEHPPRGLGRLFPGLVSPPVPVDDYAAVLIAEDYLAAQHS